MERREFLVGAGAAAVAGLTTASTGWAQGRNDKMSRIAIMMFGLNGIVKNNFPPSPERTIDIMDIGQLCADRYKVHQVELQSNYFPSTEMSWLKDFRTRLNKTKTKVVQINLEFGAGLQMTEATPSIRLQMIDLHRVWIEKAAYLGCPRLLLNQGQPTQDNKELAISNYKAIVAIAKTKNINCASENRNSGGGRGRPGGPGGPGGAGQRGGQAAQTPPPAPPATPAPPGPPSFILLTEILKASGASACVDFLNFPNQEEQLQGIRGELPITSGLVHAGMTHDLPKAMAVCRELKYNGIYSIKAMGLQGNPLDNTQKILDGVLANM